MDKNSYMLAELVSGEVVDFNGKCNGTELKEKVIAFYHYMTDDEKVLLMVIPYHSIKVVENANLNWSKA